MFDEIKLEDIGNAVQSQIDGFDQRMESINSVISFGLNDPSYHNFYQIANNVSIAISGVCLAMAVIFAYLAIVKEGLTLRGDWKKVVTILLRLAITKGLIDSSTHSLPGFTLFHLRYTSIILIM
jgi:hypothetical protein